MPEKMKVEGWGSKIHDLEYVEQLPFVGVEALDLYVENGVRIDRDPRVFKDIAREDLLVGALARGGLFEEGLVPFEGLEARELGSVPDPAVPYRLAYQVAVGRVRLGEEAAVAYTVGLVPELLRHQRVEIL